jgi:hypothetical protein
MGKASGSTPEEPTMLEPVSLSPWPACLLAAADAIRAGKIVAAKGPAVFMIVATHVVRACAACGN